MFYFLTNNIKHVNIGMYLYSYINKDQGPKTVFEVHNHINSEMQAKKESRDTSRDKQVCALKKIRLSCFRIYFVQ